ncbi:MAG: glycoside hydrolase family 18 protein [Anaerolineae bacterium]
MLLAWPPFHPQTARCTGLTNAAWVDVAWTSTPPDEAAIAAFAEDAAARGLSYIYPYISYLTRGGTFSPSYSYAPDFVAAFKRHNADTRILAWVGLPLESGGAAGVHGWVDLGDAATRARIVSFIAGQVQAANFDGVQLNAETVPNGDTAYLQLLDELRLALGPDKLISVAASHWVPDQVNALLVFRDLRWTSAYYRSVLQRVLLISDNVTPINQ